MKNSMHTPAIAVALVAALLISGAIFRAEAATPAKPVALQGVMQQLGRDMQAVTAAIATEDWPQVAQLAPKIADHPAPPFAEKLRILSWLGTDAAKFRDFDGRVHAAAVAMGKAARHGDGDAVIAGFGEVQKGCLGCHRSFRDRFVAHFHPQR